jgi:DNA-binding NarL/FixJ family response regulator
MSIRGDKVMPITILVAGRDNLTNDTLCRSFHRHRNDFKVVGSAHTVKDFLKLVAEHQPDVALISVNLGSTPMGGIQALRELSLTHASTRSIVLLDRSDPDQVVEAFTHGARGVFCKVEDFPTLCKCVRCVYAGQVWADSTQLRWVIEALGDRDKVHIVDAKGAALLTKREEQIVRMIAEGLPNSEICTALSLSPHTVKNHLLNIYNKLGVSTRAELQLYASGSRDVARGGGDPSKQSAS